MEDKNQHLEVLRQKAEHILSDGKNSIGNVDAIEVKRIFQELQINQLELEMQNDELQTTTIQLEQQRLIFSNLFELAPIGYIVTDKTGMIKDINQAGCNLLGKNKYRLINRPLLLHIYKDDYDLFYVYIQKLVSTSEVQSISLRLIGTNNQLYHVEIEGNSLSPASANALCYLTITDFTGKLESAQQLKEANQTLEIALDASLTGIWEIDMDTGKLYLDDFCCALYGYEPDNFDQKYDTLLTIVHQADRKNLDEHIRRTLTYAEVLNLKFRINSLDKNSIKYVHARAQVITDQENRKRFIGTFTDITEKTLMEIEAARTREEQQQMILAAGLQAEENEKKRISEVLHDGIAQMLYGIKLNLDQLKNTAPPSAFEQVNQLLNQSIKDIRNISFELTPSILTDFGLAATLEDMAVRLANKQLSIITKVNQVPKNLNVQLQLNIFRIIQELVNNSIKHAKASKITVDVTKVNKIITVTVADNGVGFTPFNNKEVPTGIGLSSIKNRLRLYKGTLKIESQPEAGTSVNISLKH